MKRLLNIDNNPTARGRWVKNNTNDILVVTAAGSKPLKIFKNGEYPVIALVPPGYVLKPIYTENSPNF